eukprot:TRINITY_DN64496_c0_g1_i1.p1 TRINITY_DN64496_c0_g1~~TRINITY_DN64496_c0_g1_i1.p1  ORF type:complete len:234 (-),score=41.64 TRINITY_DN64496_c0_g1_i1:74-775(-)
MATTSSFSESHQRSRPLPLSIVKEEPAVLGSAGTPSLSSVGHVGASASAGRLTRSAPKLFSLVEPLTRTSKGSSRLAEAAEAIDQRPLATLQQRDLPPFQTLLEGGGIRHSKSCSALPRTPAGAATSVGAASPAAASSLVLSRVQAQHYLPSLAAGSPVAAQHAASKNSGSMLMREVRCVGFCPSPMNTEHAVTPYSRVYGQHPKLFHYNRKGQMEPSDVALMAKALEDLDVD